jgi:hypothetical protein
MKVEILKEEGYSPAIQGLALSYGVDFVRAEEVSEKLYNKDGGHNKFLESIMIWVAVTAPRYFWQQSDTYRLSTKQSESTMHTMLKRPLTQDDFEMPILPSYLDHLNGLIREKKFNKLKNDLPEGFLQKRVWCMSYKTLRNILSQRKFHKLPEWQTFREVMLHSCRWQKYLGDLK